MSASSPSPAPTEDMSQYMGLFLDEAREQLGLLESDVLRLERGEQGTEILQSLFRSAHTLKGSSRAMGFMAIGDLTHEMENILDDLRAGKMSVQTPVVDALLRCLDALEVLIDAVAETASDAGTANQDEIRALVAHLQSLRLGTTTTAAAVSVDSPVAALANETDASGGLEISPYIQASIDEACEAKLKIWRIDIALRPDCLMKSVRVFMILGALEPFGTVLASFPGEDILEAEEFDQEFTLLMASDRDESALNAALGTVSEVESQTVAAWTASPAPIAPPAAVVSAASTSAAPTPEPLDLPKPAPAAPAASPAAKTETTATIRVDVARLDNLLNLVGELVIDRTQIARMASELHETYPQDERTGHLMETTGRIARIAGELQDQIMKARMLPVDGVFQRLPRMVRDLARKTGKEIDFQMSGGETELDRSVLESLGDPLIHLLRNAVDHGVEPPEVRVAAGKPAVGVVHLAARHQENHIVIEITDDGGGIDPVKIKAAAVRKNVIAQAAADAMTDRDAIALIFAPGFSTAASLSDISGRGVGMDIVKSNLEKLGGRIVVDSTVGVGSRFTIYLPLTLAIARALLVSAGQGTYVIPLGSVIEMVRLGDDVSGGEIPRRVAHGCAVMVLRERTLPLANLADVLSGDTRAATDPERVRSDAYVVVVGVAEQQVGLCVDGLVGEQDVVIKSLGQLIGDLPGLSGATILGDGRVALIVDVARAVETLRVPAAPALATAAV